MVEPPSHCLQVQDHMDGWFRANQATYLPSSGFICSRTACALCLGTDDSFSPLGAQNINLPTKATTLSTTKAPLSIQLSDILAQLKCDFIHTENHKRMQGWPPRAKRAATKPYAAFSAAAAANQSASRSRREHKEGAPLMMQLAMILSQPSVHPMRGSFPFFLSWKSVRRWI